MPSREDREGESFPSRRAANRSSEGTSGGDRGAAGEEWAGGVNATSLLEWVRGGVAGKRDTKGAGQEVAVADEHGMQSTGGEGMGDLPRRLERDFLVGLLLPL